MGHTWDPGMGLLVSHDLSPVCPYSHFPSLHSTSFYLPCNFNCISLFILVFSRTPPALRAQLQSHHLGPILAPLLPPGRATACRTATWTTCQAGSPSTTTTTAFLPATDEHAAAASAPCSRLPDPSRHCCLGLPAHPSSHLPELGWVEGKPLKLL